ncbi:type III PLP-dependent enzyme [Nocardioides sp. GXQ0305]|uniref:type III PLP-dependent enzyme n=1 Tax=Nocardioides sp. GXQ0305 TaxID=3423912 RepID=UPI003D7F02BC
MHSSTSSPPMLAVGRGVAERPRPRTPYLRLDVAVAVDRYRSLRALIGAAVHYAVKANPHPDLLGALAGEGCCFDVASPHEVAGALAAGARPDQLLYSNPVKSRHDIACAYADGIRLFVVDSLAEVRKVAAVAPGSEVLCRMLTSGDGSDWPLSRKFGCAATECAEILRAAAGLGLRPAGVSFHVGSQQRRPDAWAEPIAAAGGVFAELHAVGLQPWLLDLGGGFPADLEEGHPPLEEYGAAIDAALATTFGGRRPRLVIEPGRGVVADAGTLVATVVAVLDRGGTRWVYLDAGVFTGLVETLEEAIRYRITTTVGGPVGPAVLAGPTCDSADVLYQRNPVLLTLALAEGDLVELHACGAYTTCYSTVGFNGFEPLRTELVG